MFAGKREREDDYRKEPSDLWDERRNLLKEIGKKRKGSPRIFLRLNCTEVEICAQHMCGKKRAKACREKKDRQKKGLNI